mmetsp:Transcript_5497/g.9798  ORF Transcript_5497/g.9798 Transcript_5497/m.9798 type:complete len:110 (-) Transcript_5497:160-489(-)
MSTREPTPHRVTRCIHQRHCHLFGYFRNCTMSAGPPLFALDFDGVVCDSCDELYQTAYLAAKDIWPGTFTPANRWQAMPDWLVESTRRVRPVLETGWEGILMVRVLADA